MTVAIRFTADEVRLVRLALLYHLARPGAELDPATGQLAEHGLAEVDAALADHDDAPATFTLTEHQRGRLLQAMLGSVNELRVYHLNGGTASMVPGFNDTARRLFPAMAADPESALDVAEAMLTLRRRLSRSGGAAVVEEKASKPAKRGPWPFRR